MREAAEQAAGGTGSDGARKGSSGRPAHPLPRAGRRVRGGAVPAGGGVPAAFRGKVRAAAGFIGLDDHQVLAVATAAFHGAQALPIGSRARAGQWERFDDAMAELAGRGLQHILRKLRERGALADGTGR